MRCQRTSRKSSLVRQHRSPRMQTSSGIRRKLVVLLNTQPMRRQNLLEPQQEGTRIASRWWKQQPISRAKQMQRQILAAASGNLQA